MAMVLAPSATSEENGTLRRKIQYWTAEELPEMVGIVVGSLDSGKGKHHKYPDASLEWFRLWKTLDDFGFALDAIKEATPAVVWGEVLVRDMSGWYSRPHSTMDAGGLSLDDPALAANEQLIFTMPLEDWSGK